MFVKNAHTLNVLNVLDVLMHEVNRDAQEAGSSDLLTLPGR